MRVEFILKSLNQGKLDFNYNYKIHGMIHKLLRKIDPLTEKTLRDLKGFKFYTYSQLFLQPLIAEDDKLIITPDTRAKWFFSSIDPNLAFTLIKGMFLGVIKIGTTKWVLEKPPRVLIPEAEKQTYDTLSPITISKRINEKTIDLTPTHPLFYTSLEQNLKRKYEELKGKPYTDSLRVIPTPLTIAKPKRIKIKNTFHVAYHFKSIQILGSKEIKQIALYSGIGEKNSMGFGMIV